MAEKIQVWRENGRVLIRTGYSADFDLVVELYHNTNENAWLITPEMPVTDFNKGRLIHCGPDDFAASFVGEYGILSGNHASAFAVRVLIFDHGMSEKDLGTIFTDENGNIFQHFGHTENVSLKLMHGKHCEHTRAADENGDSVFGKMVIEFISNTKHGD